MKYSEKWGDSIDAAVALALSELKLTIDQVNVTVLEEPSKGFFGIGSKLAKVRVEEKVPEKHKVKKENSDNKTDKALEKPNKVKQEKSAEEKAEKKSEAEKSKKKKKQKEQKSEKATVITKKVLVSDKPVDLISVDEHPAKDFLVKTFKEMGIDVSVAVSVNKDSVYVDVEGTDTGVVIGKRGQTLDAIQYLTSLVVNKGEREYVRVVVDAEGYRAKREATLESLALRLADKVKKTGKSTRLEPMNPYERKVIHSALQSVDGITTRSEGDEPYRRVVIESRK